MCEKPAKKLGFGLMRLPLYENFDCFQWLLEKKRQKLAKSTLVRDKRGIDRFRPFLGMSS